jgi:glucoamylase
LPHGKILRIILETEATVVWSDDQWKNTKKSDSAGINALNLWFADFPTETILVGSVVEFTFFWKESQRWEGRNYSVAVGEASAETKGES